MSTSKKIPKAVPFILIYLICERYGTSGFLGILALFMNQKLEYDEDTSTALVHYFLFALFFFGIVGAIIADSWLGRYTTMIFMAVVYAVGTTVIAIGTINQLSESIKIFSLIGLLISIIGSGCIQPLTRSFGGDQYRVPDQSKALAFYFSINYLILAAGSAISRIANPILRDELNFFGSGDGYFWVFIIPAITLVIGILAMMIGKRYFVCLPPSGNMFSKVCGCIWTAATLRSSKPRSHWLEKADQDYSKELIEDTKRFLSILKLLLPLIPFWALFCQQFSRWIFQAVQMDGSLGSFTIRPDQVTVLNPILVILLIPVCDYVLYPLLSKIGIESPLQKVTLGNILAVLAFIASAVLQIQVEKSHVHVAWQIPQYILISLAEILVQVSISEFCCTESPESIKSVLQGFNSLMFGGGNLVIAFIAGSRLVESRVYEFLLFAGIMLVDVVVFWILSRNYKYVEKN